jgi:adenylate cyclase
MSATQPASTKGRRFSLLRILRKWRWLIVLGFGLLVFGFVISSFARRLPVFEKLFNQLEIQELQLTDLRFHWCGPEKPHPSIVVLAITKPLIDESEVKPEDLAASEALRAMGEKDFPWRRIVWVEVLDKLFASGAKVVAFDVVFASKNQDDVAFREAIAKYKDRIVLAMTAQDVNADGDTTKKAMFYPNVSLVDEGTKNIIGSAVVRSELDTDKTIRHADHFTSELREMGELDDSNEIPGLAALAVQKFTGKPVTAGQGKLIRYQGPRQTYPYLPVHGLFEKAVFQSPQFQSGAVFRDKIVFIGATYELAHDDKLTPFGIMAGVEVHAQITADLLTGSRLRNSPYIYSAILCFLGAICGALAVLLIRKAWMQVFVLIGLALSYVMLCQWSFSKADLLLPMMGPLVGIIITGAFAVVFSFVIEQLERTSTLKVLQRSVSKRIATELLRRQEELEHARRGERRPVAILFSDIRSFTTWSEKAAPENLVGQLNEYFECMVPFIENNEGNAQKFIGDAILAAWGDTPGNTAGEAEDSRRAVSAALKMRAALVALNKSWEGRDDRITISIGIGVNIGEVVVGEVGAFERTEYTVLGDGVNFAARLESATKQFHTDCLVGESVERLTREHFVFRHVDFIRVKGKTLPVNVYMPLSDRSVPAPDWLADYHEARNLYTQRKFIEAAALFRAVKQKIGSEDYLCENYAERCDRYAVEPPSADWDGSYTLTEK